MNNSNDTLAAFAAVLALIPEMVRRGLIGLYSDTYKDHYNFRPRGMGDWTIDELQAELDRLWARPLPECGCDCPECQESMPPEPMPTEGEGWSFTPAP